MQVASHDGSASSDRGRGADAIERTSKVASLRAAVMAVAILLLFGSPTASTTGPIALRSATAASGIPVDTIASRTPFSGSHPPPHRRLVPAPPARALLAGISRNLPITARPGAGRVIGEMPAFSVYGHVRIVAWIMARSVDGRFGKVAVPYRRGHAVGWISLKSLVLRSTPIMVVVDLSRHLLTVSRLGSVILRAPTATGAPTSPTPPGHYFVTDRVPEPAGGPLGSFAFGISGIQPHLPHGWHGGNLLAIHGTNNPGSVGTSASAGCLRVSASVLTRLLPLLRLGTPVVVEP